MPKSTYWCRRKSHYLRILSHWMISFSPFQSLDLFKELPLKNKKKTWSLSITKYLVMICRETSKHVRQKAIPNLKRCILNEKKHTFKIQMISIYSVIFYLYFSSCFQINSSYLLMLTFLPSLLVFAPKSYLQLQF